MESTIPPSGSRSWKTAESSVIMRAKALMSPLTLSTYMHRLTRLGMAKKTLLSHSLPDSMPFSLGPAVTSYICNMKSKILTTGGWLRRSLTFMSSTKRPPNLLYKSKSYIQSSIQPTTLEPYQRSN